MRNFRVKFQSIAYNMDEAIEAIELAKTIGNISSAYIRVQIVGTWEDEFGKIRTMHKPRRAELNTVNRRGVAINFQGEATKMQPYKSGIPAPYLIIGLIPRNTTQVLDK